MDEFDSQIVEILKEDGRASNARIARSVGVSEGTVRRRMKRLIDEGYIRIIGLTDSNKIGLKSQALVGVQVDPDKVSQVADGLDVLEEVRWVATTTGTYDVFAWVALPSAEAMGQFLRTKLGPIPGVRRTETFVSLDHSMSRGYSAAI